jgi:hypothetical protein
MAMVVDSFIELENKLAELANAQFESAEYKRIFGMKWTRERARIYMVQRSYFVLNRRDCWAYLQGSVPFDVKQVIWDHEKEELMGDDERGVENHYALGMREAPWSAFRRETSWRRRRCRARWRAVMRGSTLPRTGRGSRRCRFARRPNSRIRTKSSTAVVSHAASQ